MIFTVVFEIKNIELSLQQYTVAGLKKLCIQQFFTKSLYIYISERWVVCLCNEPMAVQSARHDSRLKFLPIT